MHFDRHPHFNPNLQGSILSRNVSTRSCPPRTSPPSDLEEEEEASSEQGEHKIGGAKVLKRKPRRRHTDDPSKECFSLKFDLSVDIDTEIVPAVKKKTLREVLGPIFERKGIELSCVDLFLDQSNTPLCLHFEAYRFGGHYLKVKARPGDELKVEQCVKDLRSLSLPNLKQCGGQSSYILTPPPDRPEHGSLGRRDSSVDLLGQARHRKNMTEFLGDPNIPPPDTLAQLGGSLPPAIIPGPESWKNRAASRFSVFFGASNITFGKEVDRVEQLQHKLYSYSHYGLPKVPPQLAFHQDSWEGEEDSNLNMEESWQKLLDQPEALSRRQFHQQEAIWELLHTEVTYIKKLRVITDLFLCGLLNLQDSGLLGEVEPVHLFSNVQDLVRVHTTLWTQVMQPALDKARHLRTPLNPIDLQTGFRTFASRFQPYIRYCMEEEACMENIRTLLRDNELFRIYVTWAETHKECNRLKLVDMLVKPHQRLTKYPLLLKSILKKTDDPAARDSLNRMVVCVEGFINSVDAQMHQRQEQQKLAAISARVEAYETTEGNSEEVERILREFSRLDLMAPMIDTSPEETRQLHLEGTLRMKEGKDSKMEVYCFLFTDLLLITKPVKRVEKVKVIRQPLLIHNVVCRELKDPGTFVLIYLNDFKIAVAAYSFQANSATQGRSWIDAICNVQNQLKRLRSEEAQRRHARQQQKLEEEEEAEEDESSNSTASSPSLQQRQARQTSVSEGSSETLPVMEVEPSGALAGSRAPGPNRTPQAQGQEFVSSVTEDDRQTGVAEINPQSRSLSMDSAYGTLSPQSMLELQGPTNRNEGEETDRDREEEQVMLCERAELEEEQKERRKEGQTEGGEDLCEHAGQTQKPRRRAPVQMRVQMLQTLAHKSRSEDNLLQRLHTDPSTTAAWCAATDASAKQRQHAGGLGECMASAGGLGERMAPGRMSHSRSLTELGPGGEVETQTGEQTPPEMFEDHLTRSLPAGSLSRALRTAQGLRHRGEVDFPSTEMEVMGLSGGQGKRTKDPASVEEAANKKCPGQQHKKLTLAQLYRIRTTLVLNSTLTAS
ncbi:pleckstrin homology domain-containing family G member 5 isoform X2 [Alosa pseudoharengus]